MDGARTFVATVLITSIAPFVTGSARAQSCVASRSGSVDTITLSHRKLSEFGTCVIWVDKHDQVLLIVRGTNDLIYTYARDSVTLVAERPPAALENFLKSAVALPGAATAPAGYASAASVCMDASESLKGKPSPGIEEVSRWGQCLRARAEGVQTLLIISDDGITETGTFPDSRLDTEVRGRAATINGPWLGGTTVTLRESWELYKLQVERLIKDGGSAADPLKAQRALLDQFYPGALTVLDRLATGVIRDVSLRWNFDDATGKVLRLRITNRLGEAYAARRPTAPDPGANVVTVKVRASFFEASAGLLWTPVPDQYTYTVLQDSDSSVFTPKKRDVFLPVASTIFTLRLLRRRWALGPSGLVGLHVTEGAASIGEAIDYGAMLTGGHEWLRLSVGVVWRRVVDKDRLPADTGRPFVTQDPDPRTLEEIGYRRQPYLGFVVSYRIQ